jgi:biopolymer transport protein ExbD
MRKRFRSPLEEDPVDEPLINLTPLIDVVFVVLITFMLIAPVLDIDPVDLALGSSAKKETESFQASPITVAVHADNSIWVQHKQITMAQLETLLRNEKKKYPRAVPQVVHDSKASFGTYQSVKNALEAAGFEQMDVILKPN